MNHLIFILFQLIDEDLIVTGWHFIEDGSKRTKYHLRINDKILIPANKSKLFTKINNNEEYTYYHLVLDTETDEHCGIWANGMLSEATTKSYFLEHTFKLIE